MGEAGGLQVGDDLLGAAGAHDARGEAVAALDDAVAGDLDEGDGLGVAGLEAHRGAGGDVEAEAVGGDAVERELRVGLDEVVVRADLDGPVALARDPEPDAPPALVQLDGLGRLDGHHGAGLPFHRVGLGRGQREALRARDGQEASVQGPGEVAVVGADGVVDGDEVGPCGKSAFDLDLVQGGQDRRLHVAAAEHGGA